MSDLQISLLAIGALVVGGVFLYNWIQERRFRRRLSEAFGEKAEDILLEDVAEEIPGQARQEPQLEPNVEYSSPAATTSDVPAPPGFTTAGPAPQTTPS